MPILLVRILRQLKPASNPVAYLSAIKSPDKADQTGFAVNGIRSVARILLHLGYI